MDIIKRLPEDLARKVFYLSAEHPIATMFKKHIKIKRFTACYPPNNIIQEYMIITDNENQNDELRDRAIEIYTDENHERSDIVERKVMAHKLLFINKFHKTSFVFYGKNNGIIS